jgi:hypothetical protein
MSDAAFLLFLAIAVWIANEFDGGSGGTRQRLRVPL